MSHDDQVSLRALTRAASGVDIDHELALCDAMLTEGGAELVKAAFDGRRAAKLFQALLSTGRVHRMDECWQRCIALAIERGRLAPPEWN